MFDILTGYGLWQLDWWGYIVVALVLTHLTIICVTLYLHRSQAHRAVDFHPAVCHAMRFWLWLTTGMKTKEWVAVHRKHHAKCESDDDPHSPIVKGIHSVLWQGTELYSEEATHADTLEKYGRGTPDDVIEKNLYSSRSNIGILMLLATHFMLFGFFGIAIWAIQMLWIPFFAAGIVNGIGHFSGYRNYPTDDYSTNFSNLGLLIGGEELHNNHHAYPSSARLSAKWWEFDIGWFYICLLHRLKLASVLRLAPIPSRKHQMDKNLDLDTAKALFESRLHVTYEFVNKVLKPVLQAELTKADDAYHQMLVRVKHILPKHRNHVSDNEHAILNEALLKNETLKLVYDFRHRLHELLYVIKHKDYHNLKEALCEWCRQAEQSGIETLIEFAQMMQGYALKPSLAQIKY